MPPSFHHLIRVGFSYFLGWAALVCFEIISFGIVLDFWTPIGTVGKACVSVALVSYRYIPTISSKITTALLGSCLWGTQSVECEGKWRYLSGLLQRKLKFLECVL